MSTKSYRIYILETGYSKISNRDKHCPKKAKEFVKKLKLTRYEHLQDGSNNLEEKLPKIYSRGNPNISIVDYSRVLSIYAVKSGYIIESIGLTLDVIWSFGFEKKLLSAFPKNKILATMINEQVTDFGLTYYENGKKLRTLHFTTEEEEAEDMFLEEGDILPQEKNVIEAWSRSRDDDPDASLPSLRLEEKNYPEISSLDYVDEMIGVLEKEILDTDKPLFLTGYDPSQSSIFIKKPWYKFF